MIPLLKYFWLQVREIHSNDIKSKEQLREKQDSTTRHLADAGFKVWNQETRQAAGRETLCSPAQLSLCSHIICRPCCSPSSLSTFPLGRAPSPMMKMKECPVFPGLPPRPAKGRGDQPLETPVLSIQERSWNQPRRSNAYGVR